MDERTTALDADPQGRDGAGSERFSRTSGSEMERLRDSFQGKKWTASLAVAQGIERFAAKLEEADAARDERVRRAARRPGAAPGDGVLRHPPAAPDAERGGLEESWRDLRMSVVRLKTATSRMRYSAEALADTLQQGPRGGLPPPQGQDLFPAGKDRRASTTPLLVDRKL